MDIQIRQATLADALFLTSISFGVRCYGECAENDIRKWYDHLNITKDYIEKNNVLVALKEETIIGYCGMRHIDETEYTNLGNLLEGDWIEYLFVRPAYIKMGVGSKLIGAVEKYCREKKIQQINIMSESIFNGFYERIGAAYVDDIAIVPGEKKVSWYKYIIHQDKVEVKENEVMEGPLQEIHMQEIHMQESQIQEKRAQEISESTESHVSNRPAKEETLIQDKLSELDKDAEEDEFYDDEEPYEDEEAYQDDEMPYDEMPCDSYEDEEDTSRQYTTEDKNQEEQQESRSDGGRAGEEASEQNEHLDERTDQRADEAEDQEGEYAKETEFEGENEFADKLSYEKFVSETVPIGYKFECEELAEVEEADTSKEGVCLKQGTTTQEVKPASERSSESEDQSQSKALEAKEDLHKQEDSPNADHVEVIAKANMEADKAKLDETVQIKEDAPLDDKAKANYTDIIKQMEESEEWVAEEEVPTQLASLSKAELEILVGLEEGEEALGTGPNVQPTTDSNKSDHHQMISIEKQEIDTMPQDNEKKKMLEGELYIAWGDDIVNDRRRARRLLKEFNGTDPEDKRLAHSVLQQLLGNLGEYVHIEPTFRCSYGYNISIGENFYASYDCIILDQAKVTIGDNCILSPRVGIYTLSYPLDTSKRISGYQYARPITIGNNVWIGSGVIINPGVTIGDNAVVEAGTIVDFDIPKNVLVGGNPAQIIRALSVPEAQN